MGCTQVTPSHSQVSEKRVLKGDRPDSPEKAREVAELLRNWVAKEIGAIAKPDEIRFGENLPKTRSGKIMRRLLRAIAKGEGDHPGISPLWKTPPYLINY